MNKIEKLIKDLCPSGVEYKSLGELGKFYGGITGKSKNDFINGNEKFITYKNVYDNLSLDINIDDRVYIDENENQRTLEYGDIIFTGSSETVDECGMSSVLTTRTTDKLYLNSFCFFFRFNDLDNIEPRYMKHLFRTTNVRNQIRKTASGVTRFNVSKKAMEKVIIPIPPMLVQIKIADLLDELIECSNKLTLNLQSELDNIKKQFIFYRNILNSKKDNLVRLDKVVDIYLGLTHTPKYVESGIKFISAQNTSKDFLDFSNVKYISEEEYNSITDNAKPKKGDILFTRVGSNLGHPVIVDTNEKLCIFVSLGYLRVKDEQLINNIYLKHWINSESFWEQVRKNVHGSAKINLNTGWLCKFEINLPSLQEQNKIVEILDSYEKRYIKLSNKLSNEIELRKNQYIYYSDKLFDYNSKE